MGVTDNQGKSLKEIRDSLIGRRAVAEENRKKLDAVTKELSTVVSQISEEDIAMMRARGLDIDSIIAIDFEKCKTSKEELDAAKNRLGAFLLSLKQNIEGVLE